MNSEDLNTMISGFCDDEDIVVVGLEDTGKCVPYIGWFWRPVDFTKPIRLGSLPDRFVGFMENNKWGYHEWVTTRDQSLLITQLLEEFVENPGSETAQSLFDYIQNCAPEWLESLEKNSGGWATLYKQQEELYKQQEEVVIP